MHTQQEVEIWKERIKNPEYATEKNRIENNANQFLSNQSTEIWKHNLRPIKETPPETNPPIAVKPVREGIKLRDAAFLHLLGETKYDNVIKSTLLKQIREPSVNFADRGIWVLTIGTQAPMFHVAEWVTVLLKTFEYSRDLFSLKEQQEITTWFHNAGRFFFDNTENQLNSIFVDRQNYKLSGLSINMHNNNLNAMHTHVGGHRISVVIGWRYQNRQSSQIRTYAEVGMLVGDNKLKEAAKKYVKEWVRFAMYPDGLTSEFERGSKNYPEAGFYYNNLNLEIILQISDLFARNGDTSLFDYKTSLGLPDPLLKNYNTAGGEKSIWLAVQTSCKLKNKEFFDTLTNSNKIYANSKAPFDGKADYFLIDGFEYNSWFYKSPLIYAQEGNFAQYNLYFKDQYVKETYMKSRNTSVKISGAGPHHLDQGSWGTTVSKKLMYWDLEGKVNPYGVIIPPIEEPVNENLMKLNYNQITDTGSWSKNDQAQVIFSNTINDSLFHTFIVEKKSTVKITLETLNTHGIALVKIGSVEKEVDLYGAEKSDLVLTETVNPGQVVVQIFVTGKKNPLSSNTWVVFKEIELVEYVEPEVEPETPPVETIRRYKSVRKGNFRIKINGELTPDSYSEERTATAEATFLKYSKPSDLIEVIPPEKYVIE